MSPVTEDYNFCEADDNIGMKQHLATISFSYHVLRCVNVAFERLMPGANEFMLLVTLQTLIYSQNKGLCQVGMAKTVLAYYVVCILSSIIHTC